MGVCAGNQDVFWGDLGPGPKGRPDPIDNRCRQAEDVQRQQDRLNLSIADDGTGSKQVVMNPPRSPAAQPISTHQETCFGCDLGPAETCADHCLKPLQFWALFLIGCQYFFDRPDDIVQVVSFNGWVDLKDKDLSAKSDGIGQ